MRDIDVRMQGLCVSLAAVHPGYGVLSASRDVLSQGGGKRSALERFLPRIGILSTYLDPWATGGSSSMLDPVLDYVHNNSRRLRPAFELRA